MTQNAALARVFGSDNDSLHLAPYGTALPTDINGALDGAFEDIGWLHSDGITETPTGSKTELRGHQGQRVVRTRIETPGTQIKFLALESKPQTLALRYYEKSAAVTSGVRKAVRSPGQRVSLRSAVLDIFDADDITIKERWVFPRFEVVPDGDRVLVNNDISAFPFLAEVTADYDTYSNAAAAKTGWTLTLTGSPTGGVYTLWLNGIPTAPLAYNANLAAILAALNALSGVSGITGITGSGTGPWTITLPTAGVLSATHALTGGTSPTAAVS